MPICWSFHLWHWRCFDRPSHNSHADSYMLFLVWSVPTILLSILIRYEPFYVLGSILVNLAGWFYVNPYFIQMEWPSFKNVFDKSRFN